MSDDPRADELWSSLGALPTHDLAPARVAALRRRGQAALARPGASARPERAGAGIYHRALEPAWVVAVAALQLVLAFERVLMIVGG